MFHKLNRTICYCSYLIDDFKISLFKICDLIGLNRSMIFLFRENWSLNNSLTISCYRYYYNRNNSILHVFHLILAPSDPLVFQEKLWSE